MTSFPIPLDNLIAFVQSRHPDGGPLENLADAVAVSSQLDDKADALLGHFVDRARRSGASWTEIGSRMGVSKQAARKRFIPRWDGSDPIPEGQLYSRFTIRSRNALIAARRVAAQAGGAEIGEAHMVVGLLGDADGLAAKIVHGAGVNDKRIYDAFDLTPPPEGEPAATAEALHELRYTDDGKAALRGTLTAVLRLGHNYVGTEHLLLGVLLAQGQAAATLNSFGLDVPTVETALAKEIAAVQEQRKSAG